MEVRVAGRDAAKGQKQDNGFQKALDDRGEN
jgi:hypothetical protein